MRAAGDAVGLAARKAPRLFVQAAGGRRLHLAHLAAPVAVVAGFRDHRAFAHRVEERRQRRTRRQEIGRQRCQVHQRGIEQLQLPRLVEDRKARGQMGKGLGQRLHEAAQRGFGLHRSIDRHRIDQPPAAAGCREQFEPPHLRRGCGLIKLLPLPVGTLRAGGAFKQARDRPDQILPVFQPLHQQFQIGRVGPGHLSRL